jgi:hypothetical protein
MSFGDAGVAHGPQLIYRNLNDVTGLKEDRRTTRKSDSRRRARRNDVAGLKSEDV